MSLFDESAFDGPAYLSYLISRWKLLVVVPIVAAIAATFITFFLPAKYDATGILFPPRGNDPESVISDPQFGYDTEADRLIQMLESETMISKVVEANRLIDYYKINPSRKDAMGQVRKQFRQDVQIIRTRYMSVVIKARMKSPELAADVVNTFIDQTNAVRNEVIRTGLSEQMESVTETYQQILERVNLLGDSLYALSQEPGKEQVQLLYYRFRFFQGESADRETLIKLLSEQPITMLQPSDELLVVEYLFEQRQLESIRDKMARINQRLTQPMSGVYVVDRAQPNYRKASPSLRVNILASLAISIVGLVIFLALIYRWRKVQSGD
jgi:capsular polysaccharide biosynthesis protein